MLSKLLIWKENKGVSGRSCCGSAVVEFAGCNGFCNRCGGGPKRRLGGVEAAGDDDGKTSAALQAKSAKGFPRVILAGRDVLGGVRFWGRAYEIGALGFSLRRILLSRLRRWRHYDISASVSGADFMIGGTYGRRRPRSAPRRRSLTNA